MFLDEDDPVSSLSCFLTSLCAQIQSGLGLCLWSKKVIIKRLGYKTQAGQEISGTSFACSK